MAFQPRNEEIKKALKGDKNQQPEPEKKDVTFALPVYQEDEYEKTKLFPFTLQPSVRKKIDELAAKQGYKSASKFLNELIKNL